MQPNQIPRQGKGKKSPQERLWVGGKGKRRSAVAWLERSVAGRLCVQAPVEAQQCVRKLGAEMTKSMKGKRDGQRSEGKNWGGVGGKEDAKMGSWVQICADVPVLRALHCSRQIQSNLSCLQLAATLDQAGDTFSSFSGR